MGNIDTGSRTLSAAICHRARPNGWLLGPPAGDTRTARSMRSGNVVATSMMIGQPNELPTNVARSTPTASQYETSARARPATSSGWSGRMLRPIPGRSGTNVRWRGAKRAAVGSRYVPEIPKPWTWTIASASGPASTQTRWYTGRPSTMTHPGTRGGTGRRVTGAEGEDDDGQHAEDQEQTARRSGGICRRGRGRWRVRPSRRRRLVSRG